MSELIFENFLNLPIIPKSLFGKFYQNEIVKLSPHNLFLRSLFSPASLKSQFLKNKFFFKIRIKVRMDFPDGSVVKNPLANAG